MRSRRYSVLALLTLAAAAATTVVGVAPAAASGPPAYLGSLGVVGAGVVQNPGGIAVDGTSVFVTDRANDDIQVLTTGGFDLGTIGASGTGQGQFDDPRGLAVAANHHLYVADAGNHRIQEIAPNGSFVRAWGSEGSGNGQFNQPADIAIDSLGNVFVTDPGDPEDVDHHNHRVQEFNATGGFMQAWGSYGSGNGQFFGPHGIAIAADDTVYVSDDFGGRVEAFTTDGSFLRTFGTPGSDDGELSFPRGIGVDADGEVMVADWFNDRVERFTSAGAYSTQWSDAGTATIDAPEDIAVGADGHVYVLAADSPVYVYGPAAPPPQPDGRIRIGNAALVGNNLYNHTGTGQTRRATAARNHAVTYWASVQNDGTQAEAMKLHGTGSTARFTVRYSVAGADVTARVKAGTYVTHSLAAQASLLVKIVVTVTSNAPAHAALAGTLTATSQTDTNVRDVVGFVTTRA